MKPNMNSPLFRTKAGRLNDYALSCGYVERFESKRKGCEDSPFQTATLEKEHGTYHVKGFDCDGKHFWESFPKLSSARACFKEVSRIGFSIKNK